MTLQNNMIKLTDILKEIKINTPIPNNLNRIKELVSQVDKASDEQKKLIAIQLVELVSPIYKDFYTNKNNIQTLINKAKSHVEGSAKTNYSDAIQDMIAAGTNTIDDIGSENSDDARKRKAANFVVDAAGSLIGVISDSDSRRRNKYLSDLIIAVLNATNTYFNLKEIKINDPNPYEKAYGESHSYNEYVTNNKQSLSKADKFLVDLDDYKILASFTGYNVPAWASHLDKQKPGKYHYYSSNTLKNPPPYMDLPGPLDPDDPNDWESNLSKVRLVMKHSFD